MKRSIRTTAAFLAVLLCFILLFCPLCFAASANHDCAGEHCTVCQIAKTCEQLLAAFAAACVPLLALLDGGIRSGRALFGYGAHIRPSTLVTLKTKLTD